MGDERWPYFSLCTLQQIFFFLVEDWEWWLQFLEESRLYLCPGSLSRPFDLWSSAVESLPPSPFIFRRGVVWCSRFALSGLVAIRCKWLFKLFIIKFKVQCAKWLQQWIAQCRVLPLLLEVLLISAVAVPVMLRRRPLTTFSSPDTHMLTHPPTTELVHRTLSPVSELAFSWMWPYSISGVSFADTSWPPCYTHHHHQSPESCEWHDGLCGCSWVLQGAGCPGWTGRGGFPFRTQSFMNSRSHHACQKHQLMSSVLRLEKEKPAPSSGERNHRGWGLNPSSTRS